MTLDQNSNQNSSNRDAVIAQIAAGTEGTATDGLTLETQAHFADATWSGGYWWSKMDRELGPGC